MPGPEEHELQRTKERIVSIAQNAYQQMWQRFPEDLCPDEKMIPNKDNAFIASIPVENGPELHPLMKEEIRLQNEKVRSGLSEITNVQKIAWFHSTKYTFTPTLLMFPDAYLKRVVYHEVGAMMNVTHPSILPESYDEPTRRHVAAALDAVLVDGHGIRVEDTTISRRAFRRVLLAGKYIITDMVVTPYMLSAGEMYELAFEFVSGEIMKRGSNMRLFDQLVATGKLRSDESTDNVAFFNTFFSVARYVDWRIMLRGFLTGDPEQIISMFEPHLREKTGAALNQLLGAVDEEENALGLRDRLTGYIDDASSMFY